MDKENEESEQQKKGIDHLRLLTTAISPFLSQTKKKQPNDYRSHAEEQQEHKETQENSRGENGEDENVERFESDGAEMAVCYESINVTNRLDTCFRLTKE